MTAAIAAVLLAPGFASAQTTPPAAGQDAPATTPPAAAAPADTATTPPPVAEQKTEATSPAPAPSAAPGAITAPPDSSTPPQTPAEPIAAPRSKKMGEEIVVTGSRIRRKELSTPAPVAVIGREQIQSSGRLNVGDFLQAIPEQGNAINTTVNNGGNGATEISLRNLGSQRTLVLVDGKRFITGVPGGGSLGDPGADLNSIPTAAIERIEILKDGASAVYGSDAIGGVVNIITRKRFNAVEASASYLVSQHGDAQVYDVNVIGGASGEQGSFSMGAGYYQQKDLLASARDWSRQALTLDYATGELSPGGTSRIPEGRVTIDPSTCTTALCQGLLAAYGPGRKSFMPSATTPDPTKYPLVDGWRQFRGSNSPDTYNFQAVNYLLTPSERFSLYSNGEYKLGGGARAYFHGTFVNRQSSTQLAPEPLDTGSFGVVLSGSSQYNPFGTDLTAVGRRLVEAGGRQQAFNIDTVQIITGVDGVLPSIFGPLANWAYDVSLNFAKNNSTVTTQGSVNTQLVGNAIGPSRGGVCYTDNTFSTPIPGCTPANWFGIPTGSPMTPDMVTSLGGFTGINHGGNQMAMVEANLNGELPLTLLADRPLGLALGYAYRSEYGFYTYNPIAVAGLDSDYSGTNAAGRFHVNEGYAELSIPVISNMPYVEALELAAAIRYSNYNTFGGTTTYKLGARYTPVRDFTIRGTFSTGFRAPGITSLYGGSGPNAEGATDPCASVPAGNSALAAQCAANLKRGGGGAIAVNNGDTNTQILSTSGANPNLGPEKANIFTAGVVLEPRMVKNLTITADYFNVKVTQNIGFITTPVILAGCYPGAGGTPNQAYCDLIQRGSDGILRDVTDVLQNVGETKTQGLDLAVRYSMPTEVGRFTFTGDSTFLFQYDQTLADGTVIKGLNTYDLGVNPTAKFNLSVGYNIGGFLAALRGRFVTGFHECADAESGGISSGSGLCYKNPLQDNGQPYPVHNVGFYHVYDLHLSYALQWGAGTSTISAGIRNLFDKDPPAVYNTTAQTNSDPFTYDYIGRAFYAQLQHRF